jgi:hypothetical protein
MADTLAQLTTKLQALLLDNGTLFTATTCTAAIRQALKTMNLRLPIQAAVYVDIVTGQYVYELTPALAGDVPYQIYDVLIADPSGGDYDQSVPFEQYTEDERLFFRLRFPYASGQLLVRYTLLHTINGLDSATESTLPALHETVLLDGAAEQACIIASAGKAEANNLDTKTPEYYRLAATRFNSGFNAGLTALKPLRRTAKSVPSQAAWNDKWHEWPQ